MSKLNKKVVIFHHGDVDGYAAAAVIASTLINASEEIYRNQFKVDKDDVSYVRCQHGCEIDYDVKKLKDADAIFIVDYSFSSASHQEYFREAYSINSNIYWIDHHATSAKLLEDQTFEKMAVKGAVDPSNTFSGAMLAYIWIRELYKVHLQLNTLFEGEYWDKPEDFTHDAKWELIADNAPEYIKLADDHDRWIHKLKSLEFNNACYYEGLEEVFFNQFALNKNDYQDEVLTKRLVEEGTIITKDRENANLRLVNSLSFERKVMIDGTEYSVICVNGVGNSAVFGDKYYDYDAVVLFSYDGENFRFSMFAKDDSPIDCGRVATFYNEKYGITGGGHLHAAGWSAPVNVLSDYDSTEDPIYFIKNN